MLICAQRDHSWIARGALRFPTIVASRYSSDAIVLPGSSANPQSRNLRLNPDRILIPTERWRRWRDRRRGLPVAAAPRALTPDRVLAAAIEQAYGRPLPTLEELRAPLQTPRRPAQRSRSIQSRGPLGTGPWRPLEGRSRGRAPLPARRQLAHQSRQTLAGVWQL